jgi:hypothetical protein
MALRPLKTIAKLLGFLFLIFAIIIAAVFIIRVFRSDDAYLRLPVVLGMVALPFAGIALISRVRPRNRIVSGAIAVSLSVIAIYQVKQSHEKVTDQSHVQAQLTSLGIELMPGLSVHGFLREEVKNGTDQDEQSLETNLYATIENQSSSNLCQVRIRYSIDVDRGHLSEEVNWLSMPQFDEAAKVANSAASGKIQLVPILSARSNRTGIVEAFRRSWHPRNPHVEVLSVLPCEPGPSN